MQKFRMRDGSVDTFHGRMTDGRHGPVAVGVRVVYDAVPPQLHAWVDGALGSLDRVLALATAVVPAAPSSPG
jgi:hypothetical protein